MFIVRFYLLFSLIILTYLLIAANNLLLKNIKLDRTYKTDLKQIFLIEIRKREEKEREREREREREKEKEQKRTQSSP